MSTYRITPAYLADTAAQLAKRVDAFEVAKLRSSYVAITWSIEDARQAGDRALILELRTEREPIEWQLFERIGLDELEDLRHETSRGLFGSA